MDAPDHLDTPRLTLRPLAVTDVDALWPAENAASKRVIEKLGFRAVGVQRDHAFRHDRWWDHLSFELTAPEWHALASRQTTPA